MPSEPEELSEPGPKEVVSAPMPSPPYTHKALMPFQPHPNSFPHDPCPLSPPHFPMLPPPVSQPSPGDGLVHVRPPVTGLFSSLPPVVVSPNRGALASARVGSNPYGVGSSALRDILYKAPVPAAVSSSPAASSSLSSETSQRLSDTASGQKGRVRFSFPSSSEGDLSVSGSSFSVGSVSGVDQNKSRRRRSTGNP